MPRIEATDRSISPLMMISVIGSVMIAISPLDRPRLKRLLPVRKSGEAAPPITRIRMTTTARPVSQRSAGRSRSARRGRWVAASLTMSATVAAQCAGEALGNGLVEGDGEQQQEAPDRLVPERGDAEHVQRGADRGQEQCAEGGAGDAATAAEDRDAADHDGRHDLQFVAGARGRVDRAVLGAPQDAGDAGDRAADGERGEDPPADRKAGEPRGLGVGADRVQVAARPVGAQVVGADRDHRRDGDGDVRDAADSVLGDVEEGVGQRRGVHLVAADDQDDDAADDVKGREGDDQAGDPSGRDHDPVGDAAGQTDAEPGEEDDGDRDARVPREQVRRQVGGKSQHRADRQVHVPADHDHRLAKGEEREDGRVDQDELDVARVEEPVSHQRGDRDEDDEDGEDAGLANPGDALDQAHVSGFTVAVLRAARGDHGPQRVASCWPMAAAMIVSSDASAWLNSAAIRPSRMTRMRSATPSTSGSSEEIMRPATPLLASSVSRWWTSALVPTSMPLVGSSTMSTAGLGPSHLARTTFCWLPPDSMATGSVSRPYLILSLAAQSAAMARSALALMRPPLSRLRKEARATFCCTDMSMPRPCCLLSSGTKPMPAAIALVGDAFLRRRPFTVTWPAS